MSRENPSMPHVASINTINTINGSFKLSWKPSKNDHRNYKLKLDHDEKQIDLPKVFQLVDLHTLQVFNQGNLGSCTANAIAQQIQIKTQNKVSISRLFQYWNSRLLEGTYQSDSGANLLDCYRAIMKYKYIDEALYPYIEAKYADFPPKEIYIEASKNKINKYESVPQDLYHMKYVLAVYKQPIVFGFSVYSSFQNLDSNHVCPLPQANDELLGGHAVCAINYNDNLQAFLICNSWGKEWGLNGCFYMPYDYVLNKTLCSDFWTLSLGF